MNIQACLTKAENKQSEKVGHGESETRAETETQARQAGIETGQDETLLFWSKTGRKAETSKRQNSRLVILAMSKD